MKVLTIIPSYKPAYVYGGPIRSVAALCEALASKGVEADVYTTNANGTEDLDVKTGEKLKVDGVSVFYFKRLTGDHSNFSFDLLKSFWKHGPEYDVVHIHSWWNLVVIPVMILCVLKRIKPVLSPRGSVTNYTITHQRSVLKKLFHRVLGRFLLRKAIIHVTAEQEKQDVQSLLSPSTIYVIPNILSLHPVTTSNGINTTSLKLLYLGRIDPKKNIEFLIDTITDRLDVPYTLEIVGDGNADYISTLKQKTRQHPSIHWSDPVHSDAKWKKYADADLLVLPSMNENYGNVILESLSQGTPVLISDQVGLKDYVRENNFGWVVDCDKEKWKSAIRDIYQQKEARSKIRATAPSAIQQDFNSGKLAEDYIDMYREVLKLNAS